MRTNERDFSKDNFERTVKRRSATVVAGDKQKCGRAWQCGRHMAGGVPRVVCLSRESVHFVADRVALWKIPSFLFTASSWIIQVKLNLKYILPI